MMFSLLYQSQQTISVKLAKLVFFLSLIFSYQHAMSEIYSINVKEQEIVGEARSVLIQPNETLESIARSFHVPYSRLLQANPTLKPNVALMPWHPILIPNRYILPEGPREGIVINLPELVMYYFLSDKEVMVAPLGIGREGWLSPVGEGKITMKIKEPNWTPTPAVREDAKRSNKSLPPIVPPGPDNPLGKYALLLSWKTFLIHGTNRPDGVGKRSSAGCFRMYPEDIAFLYEHVERDTPVRIINEPVKLAWHRHNLYMQAFPNLDDYPHEIDDLQVVEKIKDEHKHAKSPISWRNVVQTIRDATGVMIPIS